MARVAVVGATGLIGGAVARALVARGDEVVAVSRRGASGVAGARDVRWDPAEGPPPPDALTGVAAVVNMAGAPIAGGPWTAARRRAIHDSRVVTTRMLAGRMGGDGPGVLVNGSAVGRYGGDTGDAVLDEDAPAADDFLGSTCAAWERATGPAHDRGARVVLVRTGLVLDGAAGILPRLALVSRMFVGGPVGGGRQWMPWIHVDDEVALVLRAVDDAGLEGPMNACAPQPVRQRDFMAELGRVLGRPARLPLPAFVVRAALGEMAVLLLGGQRAVPAVALAHGHHFLRPDLGDALRTSLGR